MPVLEREEYIEQAYFFHTFRERLVDGLPAQDILSRIGEELLSTTRLPIAVSYLHTEIKGSGLMGPAMARIRHYFTPFQTHVINQAEHDTSRFAMDQALLVLEREAKFKAENPSLQALFVYQFEALARNRLGYTQGLAAMADDPIYSEDWHDYILTLRTRLGDVDFADLIYVRSENYVKERQRLNPEFIPKFPTLFGEKEGKIAPLIGGAIRCTSSRLYSASSAIPKSPVLDGPTSSKPASCSSNRRSLSSKTVSSLPRARSSRTSTSARSWSSPKTPRGSRRAGAGSSGQKSVKNEIQ